VNGDGLIDLLSHYRTEESGIALGHTEACIVGYTFKGERVEGCDAVDTASPCGIGFELTFLLPPLMRLRRRRRHRGRVDFSAKPRSPIEWHQTSP